MPRLTLTIHGGNFAIAGSTERVQLNISETTIATIQSVADSSFMDAGLTNAATVLLDATGCTLLPGLIDVHVHGAMGADTMDADPEALARMARFFAHHGVTAFLPTTMTASPRATIAATRAVAAAGAQPHLNGAISLGVHLEGPYISSRFPGAQPADAIRPADLKEFDALCDAGPVRMITLAPEIPGALALIRKAHAQGIVAVIGHSAATYAECEEGIATGISQATHTYNAMTGLHHREPGTVGSVLTHDGVYAQLIADNVHVHPAAMKVLARCKHFTHTVLITDAMRAAGLPPGDYDLGGQPVRVVMGESGGECRLANGTLAGSVLTLERGVANFALAAGLERVQAWAAASLSPATSLGLAESRGQLAPGYLADVVLLDEAGEVMATVVQGKVVYLREAERLRGNGGEHDPDGSGSL
jgi:N-acetylglucosamine-6-phosphate deacetylase